jgi:hypothetical protein
LASSRVWLSVAVLRRLNPPTFYSSRRASTPEEAADQKFVFDAGPLELGEDLMKIDVGTTIDKKEGDRLLSNSPLLGS